MQEQGMPASPGDLIIVRDACGSVQSGIVTDVKPVSSGGYRHTVYYAISGAAAGMNGLHAIGLPVQMAGVEVLVMKPPLPSGWDAEARAMAARVTEGDASEAEVLAAYGQAAQDQSGQREKELRQAEQDLMRRLPDTGSGWYTGTDTLPSADNRQLRAWQNARQMYVLTGDDEHKRNMEALVTAETPPLASDVAKTLAPPAPPARRGRSWYVPVATLVLILLWALSVVLAVYSR